MDFLFLIIGCGCNPLTTTENICEDFSGGDRCLCKSNFKGHFCGECLVTTLEPIKLLSIDIVAYRSISISSPESVVSPYLTQI